MNLSGAFRGLGVGLTQASQFQLQQQALDRRDQALLDRQTALENARAQADTVLERQKAQDAKDLATHTADANAAARIREVQQVQPTKDAERHDSQKFEERMAGVRSRLDQNKEAALVKLRHDVEKGDVLDTKVGGDGFYYAMHKDGSWVKTSIPTPPDAKVEFEGTNDTGDLVVGRSDGSVSTVEGVKPKATVDLFGNLPGGNASSSSSSSSSTSTSPRPIKVTTQGGRSADPANPQSTTSARTYTMSDFNETLAAAATDPRYKGQSPDQIRSAVRKLFADSGYTLAP